MLHFFLLVIGSFFLHHVGSDGDLNNTTFKLCKTGVDEAAWLRALFSVKIAE